MPFSNSESRANLMSFGGPQATRRRRSNSKSHKRRRPSSSGNRRRGRQSKTRVTKIRLVNGKVALRIKGYPGVQKVGASQLVRFVPINKLKVAAKRVLGNSGVKKKKHRRRRRRQHNPSV